MERSSMSPTPWDRVVSRAEGEALLRNRGISMPANKDREPMDEAVDQEYIRAGHLAPTKTTDDLETHVNGTTADDFKAPLAAGCYDLFPDALAEVARVSQVAQEQHGIEGDEIQWDRSKSVNDADALQRHFQRRGTLDTDGRRHSGKVAWRALARVQREMEGESDVSEPTG